MRIKFTIFLILLNLVLLGALFWLNDKTVTDATIRVKKLVDLQAPEVTRIHIQGKQADQNRTLEIKDGSWRITSPIDWPANLYAIQRILTHLEFIEENTHFTVEELEKSGQSLEEYGLSNPDIRLIVEGQGQSISLAFGQISPVEKKVYILGPDKQTIHLANSALLESLLVDLEDMRSQDIFSMPQYEVKGLTVKVDPINLTIIVTQEGDQWQLKAPIQTKASQRQVESMLNELRSLRVTRFLKQEEKDSMQLGLTVPSMRVTLTGNNRRQTIKLGTLLDANGAEPQFIAQFEESPSIFTVAAKPFIALKESQDKLREKRFLHINPEELSSIDILRDNKSATLQRLETGSWQIIDPNAEGSIAVKAADDTLLLDLIQQLHNLQAIRFASDAPSETELNEFGFNNPQRIVKFNNGNEQILLIGNMNNESGLFYAKIKDEPFVYEVSSRILALLQANPLHYQKRAIDSLPASSKILSITIKDISKEEALFEGTPDDKQTWDNLLEELSQEHQDAITSIIAILKDFDVESFFPNSFDEKTFTLDRETQVPWQYALIIDYYLPGSDREAAKHKTYYFTKRLGGNLQIGRTPEQPHAFRLKQELIDALFVFTFPHETNKTDSIGFPRATTDDDIN